MKKENILTSSAILINNFKKDILFTLKEYPGLYIGQKQFYDSCGNYDNSTGTLKKITDNEGLYSLLSGTFSHIVLAGMLASGRHTLDEIKEFYEICRKLNIKHYSGDFEINENDNKFLYKLNKVNKKNNKKKKN